MKRILPIALAATLAAVPLSAQETEEESDGFSLMEEGAELFFRGLMDQMGPALGDLQEMSDQMRETVRAFASEMGPALMDVLEKVDEVRYYDAPELLPNGDIIIRRKADAPPFDPPEPEEGETEGENGEIEL